MKLTKMTLAAAAVMMAGTSVLAGPVLSAKAGATSTATVSLQQAQKVKLPGPGRLEIVLAAVKPGMRLRVIGPMRKLLLATDIDARRKFSIQVEQAGHYSLVLARSSPGGASSASAQEQVNAMKKRCAFGHVDAGLKLSLTFIASDASQASSADVEPPTGGDCTGGKPFRQQGKQTGISPRPKLAAILPTRRS